MLNAVMIRVIRLLFAAKHALPCIAFLLLTVCLAGLSGCSRTVLDGDKLTVNKGGDREEFSLASPIEDVFMIFGTEVAKSSDFADGYLAVVPAKKLMSAEEKRIFGSVDVTSWKDGPSAAMNHVPFLLGIECLLPVGSSSEVRNALRTAHEQNLSAKNARAKRVCVRLSGHKLRFLKEETKEINTQIRTVCGKTYEAAHHQDTKSVLTASGKEVVIRNVENELVYLESLSVVSCQ
ncbi:MAG: hypothetical protein FWG81_07585 [Betaproteobacteria bacterium]|nr:hypothetical protein [Betaproteobacteria bacterium]